MGDIRVTAPFEKIQEPHQITLHISVGIFKTVTDTCLGGQMHHPVKCMIGKQLLYPFPVRQIQADKAERTVWFESREACFLEAHIVVTVQIVNTDDRMAVDKKTFAQMKTDKPRGTGNKNTRFTV